MASRSILLTMALALSAVRPSAAQDPGEVRLFEEDETEIQIKAATKTDIPISKAPGSVTVITREQIKQSGARTIPELLRLTAGINIRWNPMVQTIDIRGFGSNPFTSRVLLMIDGVPFNAGDKGGFPQHPGLDFFVLQSIKRIEVVRGPGSALYGENAFWGVLNIVTLSGEDLQGGEVEAFGGDRETGMLGATYGQKLGDDGSIFVSGRYLESKFPMVFWAEEQDSKVDGSDVFVKGTYKGLQVSYYRHEDTVDGYQETFPPEEGLPPGAVFASAPELTQEVEIASAKYTYESDGRFSIGGDVSYSRRFGSHCGGCHALPEREVFQAPADHGYLAIGDFNVGLHMVDGHDFLLGVETRKTSAGDHVDELGLPIGHHQTAGEEIVPGDYAKTAFYFQDQMSFADDRFRVVAGFRYDGASNLFDDKFSPRVATVFDATDRLVLRGGWSTAFRFPNFSELYQDSWFFNAVVPGIGGVPLGLFNPNPEIVPEQIKTFEVGAEYRFTSALSAKADFYRSRLKDYIVLTYAFLPPPNPALTRFENHPDQATIIGSELELRYRAARGFRAFATWSWQDQSQDGELRDSVGNLMEFSYASANKITAGGYWGPFSGVSGNFEVQWRDEYTAPAFWYLVNSGFTDATVTPLPSYALVNFRLSYDLPLAWGGNDRPWQLSFYGKNLLDEQPRETLIGVDSRLVGREFFFGTTIRF